MPLATVSPRVPRHDLRYGAVQPDRAGAYRVDINGTVERQFDRLIVSNTANLAGTLDASLLGGYVPAIGDAFRVLAAAAGVIGRFDQVDLPDFGSLAPRIDYSDPYSVFVRIGLTGDLNGDGFVGIADLNIVLGNWNIDATAGVWGQGDPLGDGFVGLADLDTVLGNWNAGTPPNESTGIPEPGVLVILGPGLAASLLRSRALIHVEPDVQIGLGLRRCTYARSGAIIKRFYTIVFAVGRR